MIARFVLRCGRGLLRALATPAARTTRLGRVLRAVAMVPVFGALLVLLRLRLLVIGPLVLDTETRDGVRMRCHLPDLIQMYVWLFGIWEPDLTAFLCRSLRAGDTFVDVGANVGCMTALASRCVGVGGSVIAIEPSPDVLVGLQDTIARNALENVRVIASAVSDVRGEVTLFAGPRHNVGLTATVAHRGMSVAGRVAAAPLGELVPAAELANARLVKIDVEGAEDRVLAGLLPVLSALRPDAGLIVELSPTWWRDRALLPIQVLQPFLDAGFHVYVLPNDYWPWRYLWPHDVSPPRRLRDLSLLSRRLSRLDIVLSRVDAPSL